MNKFVFIATITSLGLTVAGLAPARPAPASVVVTGQESALRVVQAQGPSWTCAHNRYRSVECP
jgi:hypothetical protein